MIKKYVAKGRFGDFVVEIFCMCKREMLYLFLHLSTIFLRFTETNKSRKQSDPGDSTLMWCVVTRVASRTSHALSRATKSRDFSRMPTRLFVAVVVVSCFVVTTAIDRCAPQRVAIRTSRHSDKITLCSHAVSMLDHRRREINYTLIEECVSKSSYKLEQLVFFY